MYYHLAEMIAEPSSSRVSEPAAIVEGGVSPNDSSSFHHINGIRAFEEVVGQLVDAIASGEYQAGDRLPNMAELADSMGVSKPTVGEAVKVLGAVGVLLAERGTNGGLSVLRNDIPVSIMRSRASTRRRIALAEVLEARRPVELEIGRLAGLRGTERDWRILQQAVDSLRVAREADDLEAFVNADNQFHLAMGRASQNKLLAEFQRRFIGQLFLLLDGYRAQFNDPEPAILMHQQTLDALRSRDRAMIRRVVLRHVASASHVVEH